MTKDEFLRDIQERLNLADKREAETAARSVLAATTDRITRNEALDLAAQLPQDFADFIRGRGTQTPQKMDSDLFISRVQGDLDLTSTGQAINVISGVFSVIKEAVTPGEWEDVAQQLPGELRSMFIHA